MLLSALAHAGSTPDQPVSVSVSTTTDRSGDLGENLGDLIFVCRRDVSGSGRARATLAPGSRDPGGKAKTQKG